MSDPKVTVTIKSGQVCIDADGKETRTEETIEMTQGEWEDGCRRFVRALAEMPPPEIAMVSAEFFDAMKANNAFMQQGLGKKKP